MSKRTKKDLSLNSCQERLRHYVLLALLLLGTAITHAQSLTVSGTVTDTNGQPIPGATVKETGLSNAAITDADGRYTITVKDQKASVQVSFIGFKTYTSKVGNRSHLDITLEEDYQAMDELVVVGYGKLRKSDLTGAISSLSGEELMVGSPVDFGSGLQGKIAGVQVNRNDGAPGAGISITIRGANSISTNTQPLYVIDGIPYETGSTPSSSVNENNNTVDNPLAMINPNDIENIEVLKDASATAIYGSRGANGVILITTKQGKNGKSRIEVSTNWGFSNISKRVKVLDGVTYARYMNEANVNNVLYDGGTEGTLPYSGTWSYQYVNGEKVTASGRYKPSPEDFLSPGWREDEYGNRQWVEQTDWLDEVLQHGFNQDYNVSISGGNEKSNYAISGNYTDQKGIIKNSGYKRYILRTNLNAEARPWLNVGMNTNFTNSENKFSRTNSYDYSIIRSAMIYLPTVYAGDNVDDDDYAWLSANPGTYVRTAKDELSAINVLTSAYAEAKILPCLTFRQNIGISYASRERDTYYNRETGEGRTAQGRAGKADNWNKHLTAESMLTFNRNFGDNHRLNVVAAFTYERSNWGSKSMSSSHFPTDLTQDFDISAGMNPETPQSDRARNTLVSLLGRVNYTLMNRYIFTASFRRDGSSKFAAGNKFANFASGAVAWNVAEEEFVKRLNIFSNLKLRLSFGQTGNQGLSDYMTLDRVSVANYPLNGSLTGGYSYNTGNGPRNLDLKWETTDQYNAGIDLGFWHNRLNLTINYYHKNTKGLLQTISIPTDTGYKTMWTNLGNVTNNGLEISTNIIAVDTKDWGLSFDGNISWNRNRIHGLPADQYASQLWYGASQVFIQRNGMPIGAIYGFVEDGFYDNLAEVRADPRYRTVSEDDARRMVGEIKYLDIDGDGQITNEKDRVVIGDTNPDYTYGFNINVRWKGLTVGLFFQGVHGNDIFNGNLRNISMNSIGNVTQNAYDTRWTAETAASAKWPRITTTMTRNMLLSNRYVEDGSYFRLKNLSLNYDFGHIMQGLSLSAYASVTNVFTITNYSWFDPDVNAFGTDASRRGVDINAYPNNRTFSFGLKLTL